MFKAVWLRVASFVCVSTIADASLTFVTKARCADNKSTLINAPCLTVGVSFVQSTNSIMSMSNVVQGTTPNYHTIKTPEKRADHCIQP